MLRIRLRRVGAKKQPSYRIVVAESTAPRDGRFVETIGFYNPRTEPETVQIDESRALYWLSVGASPSDAVARIFTTHGTMGRLEQLRAGADIEALVAEAAKAGSAAPKRVVAEATAAVDVVDEVLPEASELEPAASELEPEASEGTEEG
jgi:small subunit ribosomal protein S16